MTDKKKQAEPCQIRAVPGLCVEGIMLYLKEFEPSCIFETLPNVPSFNVVVPFCTKLGSNYQYMINTEFVDHFQTSVMQPKLFNIILFTLKKNKKKNKTLALPHNGI